MEGPIVVQIFPKPRGVGFGRGFGLMADFVERAPGNVVGLLRVRVYGALVQARKDVNQLVLDQIAADLSAIDERAKRRERAGKPHLFVQTPRGCFSNLFSRPWVPATRVGP